jgi:hypothetical protein
MPHRRRKKKEAETKLIFDAESSILYLSCIAVAEETLLVPLDTCLVLSLIRYVVADELCNVHLVQQQESGHPLGEQQQSGHLPVLVRRESVKFKMAEGPVPKPVANCR